MSFEDRHIAIQLRNIKKRFSLYENNYDRLKEALNPFRKKYHKDYWVLNGLDISIFKGETIGIMGKNGAGKSTLLQIITSVIEPTEGEVNIYGKISALLELGAGFNPELTGKENILASAPLLHISKKEMLSRLSEIEEFADIGEFFTQPVRTYSSGMFVRLAFAMSICIDPDILIIDEALSVGDAGFQEKCFNKLQKFKNAGKTFLLVSHSANMISQLCDRVIVLDKGNICFSGEPREALIFYSALVHGNQIPKDALENISTDTDKEVIPKKNILHSLLAENNFHKRIGYNTNERKSGNQIAEIVDYRISNTFDEKNIFLQNETIEVSFKANFKEDGIKPRIAISINSKTGLHIYGTNNFMQNIDLDIVNKNDSRSFSFEFKNCLAPGEYFISLWLMNESGAIIERLDVRESLILMQSVGNIAFNGIVNLSVEINELC